MAQTTTDTLIQRPEESADEHSPEKVDMQNRSTGVTFETKDFKVTAGCVSGTSETSGTSSDGADEDDQDETYFSVSLSPSGIRTSRKRPKKKSRQSPPQKKMKTVDVEEVMLVPEKVKDREVAVQEKGKNRAERAQQATTQCSVSETVKFVVLALSVFLIFVHLTMMVILTVCS